MIKDKKVKGYINDLDRLSDKYKYVQYDNIQGVKCYTFVVYW